MASALSSTEPSFYHSKSNARYKRKARYDLCAPGRVQSVALRLVSEREAEIEAFQPEEYWSVEAELSTPGGAKLNASVAEVCLLCLLSSSICLALQTSSHLRSRVRRSAAKRDPYQRSPSQS